MNLLLINIKTIKNQYKIILLLLISLVISFVSMFLSFSNLICLFTPLLEYNTVSVNLYGQSYNDVKEEYVNPIIEIGATKVTMILLDGLYVFSDNKNHRIFRGNDSVNLNECIVNLNQGYHIGDTLSVLGNSYQVVGLSYAEGVQLHNDNIPDNSQVTNINFSMDNLDHRSITSEIDLIFEGADVSYPDKNIIKYLLLSKESILIISILLLSIITILIGYLFLLNKRQECFNIYRLLGLNKYKALSYHLIELLIFITSIFILSLIIYNTFFVLFIKDLQFNYLGINYFLKTKDYLLCYALIIILLLSLSMKRIKDIVSYNIKEFLLCT